MFLLQKNTAPFFLLSFLTFVSCSSDNTPMDTMVDDEIPIELTLTTAFAGNFGGSNLDEGAAIIQATDGGFVMVGTTKSTNGDITDKTSEDSDVWILKTDAQGTIQWSKTYGGSADDSGTSIVKTSDGGYVISAVTRSTDGDVMSGNAGFNDMWVFKISSSGTLVWEKTYGYEGNEVAYKVISTTDGGYLLLGVLDVTASGGEGNVGRSSNSHAGGDYWVLKLNSDGEREWSRYYGGSFTDTAYDAIETPAGGYIIMGNSDSQDVDISSNIGEYDYWILNIDAQGEILWKKNFGGSEIDLAYGITKTTDGNYVVVGDTRSNDVDVLNLIGNADVWAVKFDASGTIVWTQTYGGTQFESARDVVAFADGTLGIVASSRSSDVDVTSNYGVNDAWVVVIDTDGDLLGEKNVGGSALDFGQGITQATDGSIVITGSTESADRDFSSNKGSKDLLLIKIEKN